MKLCVPLKTEIRINFLAVIDSQQSDEIEIDRDSDGVGGSANPEQGDFELNTHQEAEEFDTDLPAEHNVRNVHTLSQTRMLILFKLFLFLFFFLFLNICAIHSMHRSILATWNVYQAFSILNQTKRTAYPYFSMTP